MSLVGSGEQMSSGSGILSMEDSIYSIVEKLYDHSLY